jgi:hypothetical protein
MRNELGPQFAKNSKAAETAKSVNGPRQPGESGQTIHDEVKTQLSHSS